MTQIEFVSNMCCDSSLLRLHFWALSQAYNNLWAYGRAFLIAQEERFTQLIYNLSRVICFLKIQFQGRTVCAVYLQR